ncbi:MAG TPA: TIGR03790 family protein, partial [Candidatus Kapabacteria bacterium]|nr:TIGR03790 family protein [Candidatus Kapabacteria bacterium]
TIDKATFYQKVWYPLENYMAANGLVGSINYIVTTKGCPLRVTTGDNTDFWDGPYKSYSGLASFNDCLALINGLDSNEVLVRKAGFIFQSRYFNAQQHFQHDQSLMPMYLTSRLDGYTVDEIKMEIIRAESTVGADQGTFVLDEDPTKQGGFEIGNIWMDSAAAELQSAGLDVLLDTTSVYLTHQPDVLGYTSWGSNDVYCDSSTVHAIPHNTYVNGAIGETYVSTSARSFNPGTFYGQSLIADWIQEGISGMKGYTDEPYVSGLAESQILYKLYTQGYTLAESFAAASPYIPWRQVVVGDPKMTLGRWLAQPPAMLALLNGSAVNFGNVAINTTDTLSVLLVDNGILPEKIASVNITGAGASDFLIASPNAGVGEVIQPGVPGTILIAFNPVKKVVDNVYAEIITTKNDTSFVEINGNGVVPGYVMAADTLLFGTTALHETVTRMLHVTNPGQLPVTISGISLKESLPEYSADTIAPIVIQPGTSVQIGVTFTSAVAGESDADLLLYAPGDTVNIVLGAYTSADPFAAQPDLLSYNDTISSLTPNMEFKQAVAVSNFSDTALTITDIELTPFTQNTYFIVQPLSWPRSIAPHSTDSVVIAFHPLAANTEYDGSLTLTLNNGNKDSIVDIALSGKTLIVSGTKEPMSSPQQLTLDQNYPNPVNASTDISFTLPTISSSASHATLTISDMLGRVVADLSPAIVSGDQTHVVFHAGALPEGMYLCKLSIGGTVKVISMLHEQ